MNGSTASALKSELSYGSNPLFAGDEGMLKTLGGRDAEEPSLYWASRVSRRDLRIDSVEPTPQLVGHRQGRANVRVPVSAREVHNWPKEPVSPNNEGPVLWLMRHGPPEANAAPEANCAPQLPHEHTRPPSHGGGTLLAIVLSTTQPS